MKPILLGQRDERWAKQKLGFSVNTTIAKAGCTITCIAMKFGLTPDVVNQKLKDVNGFLDANLVIWKKVEEALPGVTFVNKIQPYNNDVVLQNLPCLVEVDGAPIGASRHWVLFIGDHKIYDPWDCMEKATSTYKPLGVVVLGGEYKADKVVVTDGNCLVPNTPEWKAKYEELVGKASIYDTFVKAGYRSITDIELRLEENDRKVGELEEKIQGVLTKEQTDVFMQELEGVVKATDLLKAWSLKWKNMLKPNSETIVEEKSVSEKESTVNWFSKLFDSVFKKAVK